ncbi:MAG: response regulator [Bacteroidales bacterium]|nr:response regulator [Bacteroidales bacterium]
MEDKLVFIVDDDSLIRNLLEYTIGSKEGYNVTAYRTSEDCLQNLTRKPDLIILDHFFLKG